MSLGVQHERFCQEYARDGDALAAYRRAYPKTTSDAAARTRAAALLARPEVAARVAALRRPARPPADAGPTPEWTLDRLKAEAEFAGDRASHSARVAALGLLMKHFGLLAAGAPHPDAPPLDLSKLTDDQKRAVLVGLRLALGRPAPIDEGERPLPAPSDHREPL
jgi:hypothetical protein